MGKAVCEAAFVDYFGDTQLDIISEFLESNRDKMPEIYKKFMTIAEDDDESEQDDQSDNDNSDDEADDDNEGKSDDSDSDISEIEDSEDEDDN